MEVITPGDKRYVCDVCECEFKVTSHRDIEEVDLPDKNYFLSQLFRKRAIVTYCPQCNNEIFIKWE